MAGDATGADIRWIVHRTVMIGVAIAAVTSFVVSVNVNERTPMWAYFRPHTRLCSFCAGALIAVLSGGVHLCATSSRALTPEPDVRLKPACAR